MNTYVLLVQNNSEQRVKEYINSRTFHEAIVPVKVILQKRKSMMKKKEIILFPRYVFVRSDLDSQSFKVYTERYLAGLSGFTRLMTYDDHIPALKKDELNIVNSFFSNKGIVEPSKGFIKNERINIVQGPLLGLESKIKQVNFIKKEVTITLMLFNELKEVKLTCEILTMPI